MKKAEPTCEGMGYEREVCSRCNYTVEICLWDATGHDFEKNITSDGEIIYICKKCGEKYYGESD